MRTHTSPLHVLRLGDAQGISEADAPAFIAEQQRDTRGAPSALELDARKGLDPPRAKIDALAAELDLNFKKHELSVSVAGVPPITVPVYLRSLRGAARWHYRHLTPAHCTPRLVRDESGARLYADPMSCDWAHEEHARMAALDPSGVMLPLAIASDKTELCNEQTAEPVYVVSNALPLHERRQRKFWLAVAYFGSLPPRLVAKLSTAKATEMRKALLRAAIVALFDTYRSEYASNPALLGERMVDAHGVTSTVYVRVQNLIFDYPVVAAWTMTLQNSTCFCCRRRAGEFHWFGPRSEARTVCSERALVQAAFDALPTSAAARANRLRPFGLVAEFSPLDELAPIGLDRFTGITFSLLHMIYEGIWKVFLERTFAMIKAQVTTAEFNQLGKRIDTWIVSSVAPMPFIKTAFHTGISRYFHSAMKGEGWEAEVAFGKITSKDTYRDIMRFWRVLLFDLMPEAPRMQQLFTDYLEWVRLALRLTHTDTSLEHLDTYCEAWLDGAVHVMGKETLWNRIKAHAPTHLTEMIRRHASALFNDDSLGESAHIEGAKQPWDHTNHRAVDAQLAKFVTRRDVLSRRAADAARARSATARLTSAGARRRRTCTHSHRCALQCADGAESCAPPRARRGLDHARRALPADLRAPPLPAPGERRHDAHSRARHAAARRAAHQAVLRRAPRRAQGRAARGAGRPRPQGQRPGRRIAPHHDRHQVEARPHRRHPQPRLHRLVRPARPVLLGDLPAAEARALLRALARPARGGHEDARRRREAARVGRGGGGAAQAEGCALQGIPLVVRHGLHTHRSPSRGRSALWRGGGEACAVCCADGVQRTRRLRCAGPNVLSCVRHVGLVIREREGAECGR